LECHFDSAAVNLRFYLVAATATPGGPKLLTARAPMPPRKLRVEFLDTYRAK